MPLYSEQTDGRWDAIARRHIAALPKESPTRECAAHILSGGELDPKRFTTLINALTDPSGKDSGLRVVAAWCLGEAHLPHEQNVRAASALRSVLQGDEVGHPRESLSEALTIGVPALCATLIILMGFDIALGTSLFPLVTAVAIVLIIIVFQLFPHLLFSSLITLAGESSRLGKDRAAAARSLGKLADPLAVGLLARAMVDARGELKGAAEWALPKVLAAVRPDHYGILPAETTPSLCALLGRHSSELDAAVLGALGRAGSGVAVEAVRMLAHGSSERGVAQESVRAAAIAILPVLEERLRQETSAARLLRPAQSPGAPADVLLRPASSATAVPDEQLLRPSSREDG